MQSLKLLRRPAWLLLPFAAYTAVLQTHGVKPTSTVASDLKSSLKQNVSLLKSSLLLTRAQCDDDESSNVPRSQVLTQLGLDPNDPLLKGLNYPLGDRFCREHASDPHSQSMDVCRHAGYEFDLSDGRKLGFNVYHHHHSGQQNNHNVLPDQVILFFPGAPGGRALAHDEILDRLQRENIALIIVERPGCGLSSEHDSYDHLSHAEDVRRLMDALCGDVNTHLTENNRRLSSMFQGLIISRGYHVLGYSAGGPFSLAYAATSSDPRLLSVSVISGVGPSESPKATSEMSNEFAMFWNIICYAPTMLTEYIINGEIEKQATVLKYDRFSQSSDFDVSMIQGMAHSFDAYGDPDQSEIAIRPDIIRYFSVCGFDESASHWTEIDERNIQEIGESEKLRRLKTVIRSGSRAIGLYGRPWRFDLLTIPVPITFFNGDSDHGCTLPMARYMFSLCSQSSNPELVIGESKGHLWFFDQSFWDEFLSRIKSV